MTPLTEAIRAADLPAKIAQYHPDSRAVPGKAGRIICVWRDGRDLSGSVFQARDSGWRVRDHVANETRDAYSYLTEIVCLSPRDAARELLRDASLDGSPYRPRPVRPPDIEVTTPADLPADLLASTWAHRQVKLEPFDVCTPEGYVNLEMLASWIAESLRPTLQLLAPQVAPTPQVDYRTRLLRRYRGAA